MSSASACQPTQLLLLQTIEICEAWLEKAPGHECHLWAHMLSFYAKVNMADQPEELRQVQLHHIALETRTKHWSR